MGELPEKESLLLEIEALRRYFSHPTADNRELFTPNLWDLARLKIVRPEFFKDIGDKAFSLHKFFFDWLRGRLKRSKYTLPSDLYDTRNSAPRSLFTIIDPLVVSSLRNQQILPWKSRNTLLDYYLNFLREKVGPSLSPQSLFISREKSENTRQNERVCNLNEALILVAEARNVLYTSGYRYLSSAVVSDLLPFRLLRRRRPLNRLELKYRNRPNKPLKTNKGAATPAPTSASMSSSYLKNTKDLRLRPFTNDSFSRCIKAG